MRKSFALPSLPSAAGAIALLAVLPVTQACADHHMENERATMETAEPAEQLTLEERRMLEQRVEALARQMQDISRELTTIQSQMRAAPR